MGKRRVAKVAVIVQARMGSTRLPDKSMRLLHGIPIVEWVYRRMSRLTFENQLIFAVPENNTDDALADFIKGLGVRVYRGSECDVLDRFYKAALECDAELVVRVCADNPFVSASEVDRLIHFYQTSDCDYAYNHIPKGNRYPDGLGAEIASFETLEVIHREATEQDHREHIFNYVWDNEDRFSIATFDPDDQRLLHPELKLDVDTPEDFERLERHNVRIDMEAHEIVAALLQESV